MLEETIKDLDKTLQELTMSVVDIVKYLNTIKLPTAEVEDVKPKATKKSKPMAEQPIVIDAPEGNLDGEEIDAVETIEVKATEIVKDEPVKKEKKQISLEQLKEKAQELIAFKEGDSSLAKAIIMRYGSKISEISPTERVLAYNEIVEILP